MSLSGKILSDLMKLQKRRRKIERKKPWRVLIICCQRFAGQELPSAGQFYELIYDHPFETTDRWQAAL